MCYPKEEGGLGFKSLLDICNSFSAKRWWRLRTENSLWSEFFKSKYCQMSNLLSKVISCKHSRSWKDLLTIRERIEQNISWKIKKGNSLFWWDNWTCKGSLFHLLELTPQPGNEKVCSFVHDNHWDLGNITYDMPGYLIDIISDINIGVPTFNDKAIWNLSPNGTFSCSSAF